MHNFYLTDAFSRTGKIKKIKFLNYIFDEKRYGVICESGSWGMTLLVKILYDISKDYIHVDLFLD